MFPKKNPQCRRGADATKERWAPIPVLATPTLLSLLKTGLRRHLSLGLVLPDTFISRAEPLRQMFVHAVD